MYQSQKWNFYSMFHSIYQPFSIVVYNYSHQLGNKETIHRSTRVVLRFPSNANCVLITHGRLVHSGAQSKLEGSSSFNTSHDLRMFAYLSNIKSRQKVNEIYTKSLAPDTIDTQTFRVCSSKCTKCKNNKMIDSKSTTDTSYIDVEHFIQSMYSTDTNRTNRKQFPPKKILGDMDELGWEIYSGIDLTLIKHHLLQRHLQEAVIGKGKDAWSGINSTKRMALKLDKLLGEGKTNITSSIPMVFNVFDDIMKGVLKQIPYLGKNTQYDGRALLGNFGILKEQQPHRDFQQIRK